MPPKPRSVGRNSGFGPDLISIRLAPGQAASRVIKGGSHLCAANYCSRYRPAARQPQETDLAAYAPRISHRAEQAESREVPLAGIRFSS